MADSIFNSVPDSSMTYDDNSYSFGGPNNDAVPTKLEEKKSSTPRKRTSMIAALGGGATSSRRISAGAGGYPLKK